MCWRRACKSSPGRLLTSAPRAAQRRRCRSPPISRGACWGCARPPLYRRCSHRRLPSHQTHQTASRLLAAALLSSLLSLQFLRRRACESPDRRPISARPPRLCPSATEQRPSQVQARRANAHVEGSAAVRPRPTSPNTSAPSGNAVEHHHHRRHRRQSVDEHRCRRCCCKSESAKGRWR